MTIPDRNKIIVTNELIKDYNVFRYDKLPSNEEKAKYYSVIENS
jgi:hypothetical protein